MATDQTSNQPVQTQPAADQTANQTINQTPTQPAAQTPKQGKPKSNTAVIIIIIIVVVLALLGVGGYFGYRYIKNYLAKKVSQVTNQTSSTQTSSTTKVNDLVELFKYPRGTVTSLTYNTDYGAAASILMETSDTPTEVYNYYDNLITTNNWVGGSKGLDISGTGAWLKVSESDFQAEVTIKIKESNSNMTEFSVAIYSSNDTVTSSRKKPTTGISSSTGTSSQTSNTVTSPKGGQMPVNGYVIPDSSTRIISESELTSLTPWQLKVARNEIYARHGREFIHQDLSCYFATQNWYSVDPNYTEASLSYTDNKNVATILSYEEKISSPYLRTDSGC